MIPAPPSKLAPAAWFVDVLMPVEVIEPAIPAPLVATPAAVAVPTVPDPVCAAEAPEPVSVALGAAVLAAALTVAVVAAAPFEATALPLAAAVGDDPSGVRDTLCAVYVRSGEDGLVRSRGIVVEMKLVIINPTNAISISVASGRTPL
jgi:hypothetical protein